MIRKIVQKPNKTLFKPSKPVKDFDDPEIQALITDLIDTIKADENAAGLAAPQIGENKQIFTVKDSDSGQVRVFANPDITHRANKKSLHQEACLSVPGKAGLVERAKKVIVKAYDKDGGKFKITAKGFLAQVIQHEYDHLQGTLFIDKAEKVVDVENKT